MERWRGLAKRSQLEDSAAIGIAIGGGGAVEITHRVSDQVGCGVAPITAHKAMKHCQVAARVELKDQSSIDIAAAIGCAVEIARRVPVQTRLQDQTQKPSPVPKHPRRK